MQTTLRMCAVYFSIFIRYVDQGCFNADKLPIDGCSQTTAILLAFIPNWCLEDIESVGIVIGRLSTLMVGLYTCGGYRL